MAIQMKATDETAPKKIVDLLGRLLVRFEGVSPKKQEAYQKALAEVEEALRGLFDARIHALKYGLTDVDARLLEGILSLADQHSKVFDLASIKAIVVAKQAELQPFHRRGGR